MKYLLAGAGRVGKAVASDLLSVGNSELIVADSSLTALEEAQKLGPHVEALKVDAAERGALEEVMNRSDVVINVTDGSACMEILTSAIKVGTPYVDVFGTLLVEERLSLDEEAKRIGVPCVIGAGCSPGLANMTGAYLARRFSGPVGVEIEYLTHRPINSSPGLLSTVFRQYFSDVRAPVFENGAMRWVPPFSSPVSSYFPGVGTVELVCTPHSEPITMPRYVENVRDVSVRGTYPAEVMGLLKSLTEFSLLEPDLAVEVLGETVPFVEILKDAISRDGKLKPSGISPKYFLRVRAISLEGEDGQLETWTYTHAEDWDELPQARVTALPASFLAQLLADGSLDHAGVYGPEVVSAKQFEECVSYLEARGLMLSSVGEMR